MTTIGLPPDGPDERIQKRMEFSRALAREGYDDVLTLGRESARELLSPGPLEIIDRLREGTSNRSARSQPNSTVTKPA